MAATRILVVEDEFLIALDIAGVLEQAGLAVIGLPLRDRSALASGTDGDDADVGEQVRRDLIGDAVESVEYLSAPTDHL